MAPYKHPPAAILLLSFLISAAAAACPDPPPAAGCTCETVEGKGEVIKCRDLGLFRVPDFTDTGITYYELTLDNNLISSLTAGSFANLRVRRIVLTNNPLIGMANAAFSGLEDVLEELLLDADSSEQEPVGLNGEALKPLKKLRNLQLRHFGTPSLPSGLLRDMTSLQELSVLQCGLKELSIDDVEGIKNSIKSIDFTDNAMTSIPTNALSSIQSRFTLQLSNNQLDTLATGSFREVKGLQSLDLSRNAVSINENAFVDLEDSLNELTMHSCQLHDSDLSSLTRLEALTTLSLHTNEIERIPSNFLRDMKQLTSLDLGSNMLTSLRKAMLTGPEDSLLELIASDNPGLVVEADAFEGFTVLKILQLNKAGGLSMENAVFEPLVASLQRLSLTGAGLDDSKWPMVSKLKKLQVLQLSSNSFTSLPELAFDGFDSLTTLELNENQLTSITQRGTFGLQKSLEQLSLIDNSVATISHCALSPQDFTELDIFKLQLQNNPLICDCRLLWLHEWLMDHKSNPLFITIRWKCADEQNKDQLLKDLDAADLCDPPEEEEECEDLRPATTQAPTTEQPSTTEGSDELVLLGNSSASTSSSISVTWKVPSLADAQYFLLEYRPSSSQDDPDSYSYPRETRAAVINGLASSTSYEICITMITVNRQNDNQKRCTQAETAAGDELGPATAELQIILGVSFGVLACVLIVVVAVVCCLKRHKKEESFDGGELGKISSAKMPTAGYNSKRFMRQKPRHNVTSLSTMDIDQAMQNASNKDRELREKVDGFTPEERDKILQMLRQSGGSTLSVVSAASSHRYVPEPPPCRGAEGYSNPVDIRDENPYEEMKNEYEEIPADTYDHIPYDHYI